MTLKQTRNDALPEGTDYTSIDGCDVSPTCLDCPLERCQFDLPGGVNYEDRALRWQHIWNAHKKGVPKASIARSVNVSMRTVLRAIQNGGEMEPHPQMTMELDEPAKVDPCDLPLHNFKPRDKNAPAFVRRRSEIRAWYMKSCPRCVGDVALRHGSMQCVHCGWEVTAPEKQPEPLKLAARRKLTPHELGAHHKETLHKGHIASQEARQRRVEEARRLHKSGMMPHEIAAFMKMGRRTIFSYLGGQK